MKAEEKNNISSKCFLVHGRHVFKEDLVMVKLVEIRNSSSTCSHFWRKEERGGGGWKTKTPKMLNFLDQAKTAFKTGIQKQMQLITVQ